MRELLEHGLRISVESHDQVFPNGFERSNMLDLGGSVQDRRAQSSFPFPSQLVVVMKPRIWVTFRLKVMMKRFRMGLKDRSRVQNPGETL
jgi:hypothetical protein